MIAVGTSLTFIQIGTYDGTTTDPLCEFVGKFGWQGVLVEPQPDAARKLRELYCNNDQIVVLEAAVDRQAGKRTLFTVPSDGLPLWVGGMASFNREHITKHSCLIPGLDGRICEINVDCITFADVVKQVRYSSLDLLQIDAEGADACLLKLFPFEELRPPIVHWEIKNLTLAEREQCFDRLVKFGYRFAPSGDEDMMAILDWA